MTPERWQHIKGLFQEAIDRSTAERGPFVDEVCAGDEDSRNEIQSLISFHARAQEFLEVPALEAAAGWFAGDHEDSLLGTLIGSYKIEARLGAGGMGEVYLAEDTKLDRKVAIKFLPKELEQDELARRRQIREAKAAARLDHPNICGIHEVATHESHSFIVMQYVEGETLSARMKRRALRLSESLDVAIQVADALSLAHSRGIVHRDIKPQNIMITMRGQVKVLDFGLAKMVLADTPEQDNRNRESAISNPGLVVGTPLYMSPEQAKGEAIDGRGDLFSLGAVLYECVTRRRAFAGNTTIDMCAQVVNVDPPAPSDVNHDVPPELDRVILKALAKDRDSRHQSAEELRKELKAVRNSLGIEGAASGRLPVESRASRASSLSGLVSLSSMARHPRVLVPAVLVVLAALSIPLWWRAAPYRPSPDALRWYELGTAALRDGTYYKASKAFEQAIKLDDNFALAHARLAEAWTEMDYSERAKDELLRISALDRSLLQRSENVYVQAITNTVVRDFGLAIRSYQEIAQSAASNERLQVYLDLGRAYEKNDQLEEAKQHYLEGTQQAPEDGAAFLRLGIINAQQQNDADANRAFDAAQTFYETVSNIEGIVEVFLQRSILFAYMGKLGDARSQAQKGLDIAKSIDSKQQQIRTLLALSRVASAGGETSQAQRYANEAMDLAQVNDMENLLTEGLIELGNAFRVHGDYAEAEKYFEKALELAQQNKGHHNEAKARVALGGLFITLHDADKGLDYAQQALTFFEKGGYRRDAAMAFHQFGRAYELKGDANASRHAHERELGLALDVSDQSQMALAHRGIALALAYQEHYAEALPHFEESYSLARTLVNNLYAGNRLINIGDMKWKLGRYQEARADFNDAISIAKQPSVNSKQMLDTLRLVEASMELSAGNFPESIVRGREALDLNAQNEHATEAKYVIGLAQVLSGARHEGMRNCADAVQQARHTTYAPILSGALLSLAEALIETGDAQDALAAALEARNRFETATQQDSEWRSLLLASRASLLAGDVAKAHDYARRSEGVLSTLQQQLGPEAYSGYLTRPDITRYRRQLGQVLSAN